MKTLDIKNPEYGAYFLLMVMRARKVEMPDNQKGGMRHLTQVELSDFSDEGMAQPFMLSYTYGEGPDPEEFKKGSAVLIQATAIRMYDRSQTVRLQGTVVAGLVGAKAAPAPVVEKGGK